MKNHDQADVTADYRLYRDLSVSPALSAKERSDYEAKAEVLARELSRASALGEIARFKATVDGHDAAPRAASELRSTLQRFADLDAHFIPPPY